DTEDEVVRCRAQLRCNCPENPNGKSARARHRGSDVRTLQTGDPALLQFIRETIGARGPVPFAWVMEQALYHPQHGYYSSGRCTIGRAGDYFTSVSVGPVFGRLMALQYAEIWEVLGRPGEFRVVEQGAHGGEFAHDVLSATAAEHPAFFAALRYAIVEPFPVLKKRQEAALRDFARKVEWHASIEDLPPFAGAYFSNELLDAMPVHLIRWTGGEWKERHVAGIGGDLSFVDLPLSDVRISARLAQISFPLPKGYETEVSLAAVEWIEAVAAKLESGFVITADYGFSRDERYAPHRITGTLRGYAQHRAAGSPLQQIGHADITAHVDWTSIAEAGEASGLQLTGFADQHHFITGLLTAAGGAKLASGGDAKTARALQTLLHPAQLGMKFQYLVLQKNVATVAKLSGLRFARATALSGAAR
ncbi:MAG: SAM-dependent methyltransferase, partial [Verrucomicrobiota bacterium]|nr:SAM-dependent methyltransferase [Verrucomicrobiota bacterium]